MNRNTTFWEGFAICGDASELDRICRTEEYISLDSYDITRVLSSEGDNYVTTGIGPSVAEALKAAITALPKPADKITEMVLQIKYGTCKPTVSDLQHVMGFGNDTEITWGIATEPSLGENFKVVIAASIP